MYCESSLDQTDAPSPSDIGSDTGNATLTLASKDILFKAGDRKTQVYRVESGVICLYDPRWNKYRTLVDFVFPGDLVGLGFLESHTLTARAIVETRVTCVPSSALAKILADDPKAQAKLAEAVEREFEARRDRLSDTTMTRPVERVAALLVNLSCSNTYEGRDPHLIVECWDCGTIADMLDLTVDDLMEILVELEQRELIGSEPSGALRLKNIAALEALADGKLFSYERRARPPKLPAHCSVAA